MANRRKTEGEIDMDRRKLELEVEVRLAGQQRPRAVIQCVLRVRHVSLFCVCVWNHRNNAMVHRTDVRERIRGKE